MIENSRVSLIVSIDNNYIQLSNFFEHIASNVSIENCEIIAVLDGVKDIRVLEYMDELVKRGVVTKENRFEFKCGYAAANNKAVKMASGEYLVFINTDVYPKPDAIQVLLAFMEITDKPTIAQGLLLYPQSNLIQSTGHVFGEYFNSHALTNRNSNILDGMETITRQALTSAFYIMRTQTFDELGGFDEYYFNCWEGMELALKATYRGYQCVCVTKSIAHHATGGTRGYNHHNEVQETAYFWTKWGGKIKFDLDEQWLLECSKIESDSYICINVSSKRDFIKYFNKLNIEITRVVDIDGRYRSCINLYDELPFCFLTIHESLLFFADDFKQLSRNTNWIQVRNNKKDIVLDTRGNILNIRELL